LTYSIVNDVLGTKESYTILDRNYNGITIHQVGTKELKKCNISNILDIMNHLENILGFVGCNEKLIICFSGYDDDSREIHQIPEIRKFMLKLVTKKPLLPYFLSSKDNYRAISMCCVGDVNVLKVENGITSISAKIPKDISHPIIVELELFARKYGLDVVKMRESMKDIPF